MSLINGPSQALIESTGRDTERGAQLSMECVGQFSLPAIILTIPLKYQLLNFHLTTSLVTAEANLERQDQTNALRCGAVRLAQRCQTTYVPTWLVGLPRPRWVGRYGTRPILCT